MVVLDHVLYFQVLDHDCAVVLDIGIGGFVQEILYGTGDKFHLEGEKHFGR
jgi:hypothetical protein